MERRVSLCLLNLLFIVLSSERKMTTWINNSYLHLELASILLSLLARGIIILFALSTTRLQEEYGMLDPLNNDQFVVRNIVEITTYWRYLTLWYRW